MTDDLSGFFGEVKTCKCKHNAYYHYGGFGKCYKCWCRHYNEVDSEVDQING